MARGFPPQPVYPDAIDSDFTLYLVHNTTESILDEDNGPWTEVIDIVPVKVNDAEIWADNGFGNINGELFYYDSVAKDSNDKVTQLTNCVRNLGGTQTKFISAGAIVRGFVVAQHHNQLVVAICNIEKFIGFNFDTDVETLDFRIRCLRDVPICPDDFLCPDVIFNFDIEETNANGCVGIRAEYSVEINGSFNSFRIDFGDGTSTTSVTSGIHIFSINQTVDPVVTVSNDKCQIVQTPISRTNPVQPTQLTPDEPFEIPTCEFTPIPPFSCTPIIIPEPDVVIPPIILPCVEINVPSNILEIPPISITPITIDFGPAPPIPSTITFIDPPTFSPIAFGPAPTFSPIAFGPTPTFSPIGFGIGPTFSPIGFGPVDVPSTIAFTNVPSFGPIAFTPVDIPTTIAFTNVPSFSPIGFGPVDVPSTIAFTNVPSFNPISFTPIDIPSTITFTNVPSFTPTPAISAIDFTPTPSIDAIDFTPTPSLDPIAFGPTPTITIDWSPTPSITCTVTVACPSPAPFMALGEDSNPFDPDNDVIEVDIGNIGIPSIIKLDVPKDFPDKIELVAPTLKDIKITGPEQPLPSEIKIISKSIPERIQLIAPKPIKLDARDVPKVIALQVSKDFPRVIKLDASSLPSSIQVTGLPSVIELKHNLPTEIQLVMPENPKVEMVYKGAPLELKIKLDIEKSINEDGEESPCVMIVPCNKK